MPNRMATVEEMRQAAGKVYRANFPNWAVENQTQAPVWGFRRSQCDALLLDRTNADLDHAVTPVFLFDKPLHPPSESEVLANPTGVRQWLDSWRQLPAFEHSPGVLWEQRNWPSAGTQSVPVRLRLSDPTDVAHFARETPHWKRAQQATQRLLEALLPDGTATEVIAAVVRALRNGVAALPPAELERLANAAKWFIENPNSGLYPRQVPIRGIDTKWIERHQRLLKILVGGVTGSDNLGLAKPPDLIRLRILDRSLRPGGISELSTPISELIALNITPNKILIIENLQTLLALPELPGVVAIHGQGYAVYRLQDIPWVRNAEIIYWGDLDMDGFNILARLRSHIPQIKSIMMASEFVTEFQDLGVPEPNPRGTNFAGPLTDQEQAAIAALRAIGQRIEQERLPWARALAELGKAGLPV